MSDDPCVHGKPNLGRECSACARAWENVKASERFVERFGEAASCTCHSCETADTCKGAWDFYNIGGDCLMEK
jgi:hypothetical protein